MTSYRIPSKNEAKVINFTFDGRAYQGREGDSLAAALLANGVRLAARSFKYHRPRGVYTAGHEEPNALVDIHREGSVEPNSRATTIEIYEGLQVRSQNRWPSLKFDLMAINSLLSPLFTAGFYYKTFMWPAKWWMFYEKIIRRAAGLGKAGAVPDKDRYESAHAFCDILVIGAGPAGIEAALKAAEGGKRVILVEQEREIGGSILSTADAAQKAWLLSQKKKLDAQKKVTVMTRSIAVAFYDHNSISVIERVSDHLNHCPTDLPRQRLWSIKGQAIIMACGATERPFVFGNNDLPGIMLASAAKSFINRFGVCPGKNLVLFTNNDSVYDLLDDVKNAGATIRAVVDSRSSIPRALSDRLRQQGIPHYPRHVVTEAKGRDSVKSVVVHSYNAQQNEALGKAVLLACDGLLISAGWSPAVHLHGHIGVKPLYNETLAAFTLGELGKSHYAAGAILGHWDWGRAVHSAQLVAQAAVSGGPQPESAGQAGNNANIEPLWVVPSPDGKRLKKFVDFQHDVTADDVEQAHREGYVSVEHMKRYTTLGMATDQGKLSNVNGLAIMAQQRGTSPDRVGTTTFRPPFVPVALGSLAATERDRHLRPERLSPMHRNHVQAEAKFIESGLWLRPWYYPKGDESLRDAYIREAAAVRQNVGITDVSSLGKIDVQGPDAAEFLNRVYTNGWKGLAVGKARYGLMLRSDGYVMDDGTTWRLSEYHFFMTTTTANAAKVMSHLEYLLDCVWPDLKVHVTSCSEQWAAVAVAGLKSRALLQKAMPRIDFSNEGLPFMGVREGEFDAVPIRIARISFSGEMAFEVYTPAGFGPTLWDRLTEAGQEFGLTPYGLEALGTLRIEKGHIAGPELDGRTTLADLGLAKMASSKKPYWGQALAQRPALSAQSRQSLVGIKAIKEGEKAAAGSILFASSADKKGHGEGWISSTTYSPALGEEIALALLENGSARQGETILALNPVENATIEVKVVSPHFFDPKGERMHV